MLTWGQTWWKRIAEVFTAQANQTLGTKLTVEVTEANTVFQRLRAGDYQASAWGWLGFIDPDEYTYDILHTKGWRNFDGYSNPKLDAMLEQARRELDKQQARRYLQGGRDSNDRGHAYPPLLLLEHPQPDEQEGPWFRATTVSRTGATNSPTLPSADADAERFGDG